MPHCAANRHRRVGRREAAPAVWAVVVDALPLPAKETLLPVVQTAGRRTREEAEKLLANPPFTVASGLTRGEAEELLAVLARERVQARVVESSGS
jgi:hypothetical protein